LRKSSGSAESAGKEDPKTQPPAARGGGGTYLRPEDSNATVKVGGSYNTEGSRGARQTDE